MLFSEDAQRFYYGDRSIDKDQITAVRVLINGASIAAFLSKRAASHPQTTAFDDRPEGIARDRWDVAIETVTGPTLVAVRRHSRARVPGAGAGGLRRGQAGPGATRRMVNRVI